MTELRTDYLGLDLTCPLVASAGPITADIDGLRRLEAAGAGAVVLPSLFEEQITHEELEVERMLATGAESVAEAHGGYFPELDEYNTGPDVYLTLVEKAKSTVEIPVIASLNGVSRGGWVRYASLLEDAGADGLELNVYHIATDMNITGFEVERQYLELVAAVRDAVRIPVAVKVGPYFSAMANMARKIVDAGADGLVLFNRFYQPDLDVETMEVVPRLVLSSRDELRLPLRWIAILHGRVTCSLAATTGVHATEDVIKVLLVGADVAMMTSALIQSGPEHIGRVRRELAEWMDERGYESVAQMRGSMSQRAVTDPATFERANYMKMLTTFSNRVRR